MCNIFKNKNTFSEESQEKAKIILKKFNFFKKPVSEMQKSTKVPKIKCI